MTNAPRFLSQSGSPISGARAEAVLREVELHYQTGRRLYQGGDESAARHEFDRAIDLLLSAPESATVRPALDKRLETLVDEIHRMDLEGLGAADIASEPALEKPPLEDIPELTFPVDPKLKNKVAEELKATVSQLPLDLNDDVLSYIHYFSNERGRKILVNGLRRSGRYRPLIQRVFDEEGVPQELIFLAQAESGFYPRAVSRASATGMWQFGYETGMKYGLHRTAYQDDRFDPEKSTRAAARHLRDLYHRYGDWYLAMAAYNCGPGVIDKAVERTGYADYWEIRRRHTMPRDTANYVPAILAQTIMVKNAKEYGLEGLELDPPLEYDAVEMKANTRLELVADLTDCPVPQLRDLNPALLQSVVPSGTAVRVPKGSGPVLTAGLESLPSERRDSWRAHRVAEGDTLASIARRYHVSESALASANGTASNADLSAGDVLAIPAVVTRVSTSKTASASHHKGRHSAKAAAKAGAKEKTTTSATAGRHKRTHGATASTPRRTHHARTVAIAATGTRSHRRAVKR